MCLGNCKRETVSLPDLSQPRLVAQREVSRDTYCLHIRVGMSPIPSMERCRVTFHVFVKKAFARQVVVDTHHIRWTGMLCKPYQFFLGDTEPTQIAPQVVIGGETPTEEIKGDPATLVLELGLIGQGWCAKRFAHILRLYELS